MDDNACIKVALSPNLSEDKLNIPIRVGYIPTPIILEWITRGIFVLELRVDSFIWKYN